MSEARQTEIMEGQREQFTGALKTMDNDHAYIHEGIMFVAFDSPTLTANGGIVEYSFKTPTVGFVHYRLAGIGTSADQVTTQIFEDAVFTAATGTIIESNNKNRNSDIVADSELRRNPTFTDDGTLLPGFSSYLPGSSTGGQRRAGTEGKADSEIVFKQDTTYRFLATSDSTQPNKLGINLRWYEEIGG